MRKIIIFIPLILTACAEPKQCDGPFPEYVYQKGEKALHIPTGEEVRVISTWSTFSGDKCVKKKYGEYTVRFSDGAEIGPINWSDLKIR